MLISANSLVIFNVRIPEFSAYSWMIFVREAIDTRSKFRSRRAKKEEDRSFELCHISPSFKYLSVLSCIDRQILSRGTRGVIVEEKLVG